MAGHSKWSKIKRTKGVLDAKKGAIFTKLVKNITVAAKQGGGDINHNPSLRLAIAKAKEASMPHNNIQRAIDKATGNLPGVIYQDVVYEGYGAGGVAVYIEVISDNKNRTVANIRQAFNKTGGALGESGCVAWMFTKKGIIVVDKKDKELNDKLIDKALEYNAQDIIDYDEVIIVECLPADLNNLVNNIDTLDAQIIDSKIKMVANSTTSVDELTAYQINDLIARLESDDDVQTVYTNME